MDGVKADGGKGVVGIPAPALVPQFLVRVIAKKNGLDLVAVPCRSSAPMMSDMLGNQIPASVCFMSSKQLGAREQAYRKAWVKIVQESGFVLY